MQLTNSQIAQQYMMNTYPCLQGWLNIVNAIAPNIRKYDSVSCAQLALVSRATMKALDYIANSDSNANIIRVSIMLNTLHDTAWKCWVSFSAQSKIATGTRTITLTSTVLQAIATFASWDSALNPNPTSFNPPTLLNTILSGVTT